MTLTMTAQERLKRLVVEVLLIEDAEYQDDYGPAEIATWDSLATLMLASAVEREFGLPVPPEQMAAFNCIGDIRQFCRSHGFQV